MDAGQHICIKALFQFKLHCCICLFKKMNGGQ